MSWASNDGWEDGPGGIVSGETGLAHTGAIVYNQSSYVLVAHVCSSGSNPTKLVRGEEFVYTPCWPQKN